jgi:hypothetical protein
MRPGELNKVQVGWRQLVMSRLSDVMDVDRDALGLHLLLKLVRDHGAVAKL